MPGCTIIIDDDLTFIGCRKAVDECRQANGIDAPRVTMDADSEA